MAKQRRRPARWSLAIGLPGEAPSREARALAASPAVNLPPGVWHTSAHASAQLARVQPVVSEGVHTATGARFRLLSAPDGPIIGICCGDQAARNFAGTFWSDSTAWANRQTWRIVPAGALQ